MRTIFVSILAFVSVAGAWAQSKNFLDQPYLETAAKADTLVTPDRIYLGIRLGEADTKGRISVEELERKMVASLRAIGIDTEKHLAVAELSSAFRKYFLKGQQVLKDKTFELLVSDADTAGRVLFELEKLGIANTRLNRTEYSGMDQLLMHLKARAVKLAQKQARAMTGALGQQLGPAIYISDSGGYSPIVRSPNVRALAEVSADQDTYQPIGAEFRKISVETRVQVTFRLD